MNLRPTRIALGHVLATLAITAAPTLCRAQVSLYAYSESVEPYTEITAGEASYTLGVPTWWPPLFNERAWVNNPFFEPNGQSGVSYLNPAVGPGYPIGFDFTFNGEVFDVISVSNSGFITFGKSSDGIQAVWTYAISHPHAMPFVQFYGGPSVAYKRNRVAGFATGSLQMQDMSPQVPPGPVSSLRLATLGAAPNRTFVVQFKDFRASYSPSTTQINFQIRLNEADNSVEVRYGTMVFAYQSGGGVQVGLGGSVPEDFNSRMTVYEEPAFLYDWNMTAAGVLNADVCNATAEEFGHPNGTGIPPVAGRNFKWTPDACPPPAWPLTIQDVGFDTGHAIWQATAAAEYEYFVSTENSITGPEVTAGTTTDAEAYFFGLEPATTYYVFVRSNCGGEWGAWSLATSFETFGGGLVACDGGVVTENYCSQQFDTKEWVYVSADGSPLKIEFLGGFVGTASTESFEVWEGTGPVGTGTEIGGDLAGNSFDALSGAIYIRLITDAGACEAQPWYLPLEWRVGCKNCTDPLVSYAMGTMDCDAQEFFVDANIFSLGSATSLSLENSLGLPPTVVSTTGVHAVGPFPAGQSVVVTAQNPDNLLCYAPSAPIINEPCAIADCGPTYYDYCYSDGEYRQWAFQSDNTQEIGIRFLQGAMGLGDDLNLYNSLDIFSVTPVNIGWGGLANQLFTSGAPSDDQALVMELIADNAMSCMDEDPLYGTSQAWQWVVACYDGCTQPQASFVSNCLTSTSFEVAVTVSNIGSTGSVDITNSGTAPAVTANATGTYTVGPFPAGSPVTINVEGANVLCTWTSPELNPNCLTTGVDEHQGGQLALFPNPSNGTFQLVLPKVMNGTAHVQVLDLTGRLVAHAAVNGASSTLQMEHLPNGLYTVVAQGTNARFTSTISIQH
ncbi:MAG: T9SS type A sorting domain-containing protein [Flavobacteriales bacterium]|nr:T9SS type A sorting domain-containing protein [Flavobacteriales bacterium]MBP9080310.1 T9SS type A sorting domain-containing protein [Flavobacteriales bacterium]